MRKVIVALLAVLLTCACSSIDCPVQNTVYTVYELRTLDEQPDTLRDTMYVYSRRRDGSDTILYNAGIGKTTFSLPISWVRSMGNP